MCIIRSKVSFRVCKEKGELTGTQGVVIPTANVLNVVLRDEVTQAIKDGRFHIYAVDSVEEAIELYTGMEAGSADPEGSFAPETFYGRVAAVLAGFDSSLKERI